MRVDFICFTVNNKPARRREYSVSVEADIATGRDARKLLERAWASGVSAGSVYEIQTDEGIFKHTRGAFLKRSTPATAIGFKSWDQLIAEDTAADVCEQEPGSVFTLKLGDKSVSFEIMYRGVQVCTCSGDDDKSYSEMTFAAARVRYAELLRAGYKL
jgi:hypothetical protein